MTPRRDGLPAPGRCFAGAAALALFLASLPCQRTWIVDARNGAGTDFTDLPPAVVAAAAGDHLLVRPGDYRTPRITKPLRIRGEAGARVLLAPLPPRSLEVTGIAAGETCVIHGLEVLGPGHSVLGGVRVAGCAGVVVLSRVRIVTQDQGVPALHVVDCSAVVLAACTVGFHSLFERSRVAATACTFDAFQPLSQVAGLTLRKTAVELTQCTATGANGGSFGGHDYVAAPAVYAIDSDIVVRGDVASTFTGGTFNGLPAAPSLDGGGTSTLAVDPTVTLTPPPANMRSTSIRRLPALTATGGALGASLDVTLYAPVGDAWAMLAALPGMPFLLPGLGVHWLDPTGEVLVTGGVQGAGERTTVSLTVPDDRGLAGLALAFQTVSGRTADSLTLSNPVVPVIH
jgi:hypothetical protein